MANTGDTTVTRVYTTAAPAPGYSVPVQVRTVTERTTFEEASIRKCKINGGLQAVIGLLCFIFGIVSICIDCYYGYLGSPFWCGIWFITAGSCGARVANQQGYMAMKTLSRFMTMSSVSMLFAITLLIIMSIAVANELDYPPYFYHSYAARVAIDSVLLFLSFVEIIAASQGMKIAQQTIREAKRQTTVTTAPIATVPIASPAYPTAPGYPPAAYPQPAGAYPPSAAAYPQTAAAYPPAPGSAPYGYQSPYGAGQVQAPPPPYMPHNTTQPGPNHGDAYPK